jgi:hypothetical protein
LLARLFTDALAHNGLKVVFCLPATPEVMTSVGDYT